MDYKRITTKIRILKFFIVVVFFSTIQLLFADEVKPLHRLPLRRDTDLVRNEEPVAIILVPENENYIKLGMFLADNIFHRTGVHLEVETASKYVDYRPNIVKTTLLEKHFIVIGQFWNNAVLERLYCKYFCPVDAFFPGLGGYELRTVCSPFKYGHNCIVAAGSDFEGCQRAAEKLVELIQIHDAKYFLPFLHKVVLRGEAAEIEAEYRENLELIIKELEKYAVFMHSEAKVWNSREAVDNFQKWHDYNTAAAAIFGRRYWIAGDALDAEAFKKLIRGLRDQLSYLEKWYSEGRADAIEYGVCELMITWDLIEETDAFTETEREEITQYLYHLAWINRDRYFFQKVKDKPLSDVNLMARRHQLMGTFWMWILGDYMQRNGDLSGEQKIMAEDWKSHSIQLFKRQAQSYFYSGGTSIINDEGGIVLCQALLTGEMDFIDNGMLRLLADFFVQSHDPIGYLSASGNAGGGQHTAIGGDILNVAAWLYQEPGYAWFRRQLGRWPYNQFLWRPDLVSITPARSHFNWEMPLAQGNFDDFKKRFQGIFILEIGETFFDYLNKNPIAFQGAFNQRTGQYHAEPAQYDQTYNRIAFRSGFDKEATYLLLEGLQGIYWSYDRINGITSYVDRGEVLIKSQSSNAVSTNRLSLTTLSHSSGRPGGTQAINARLISASDFENWGLISSEVPKQDGLCWTRHIFWQKNGWFIFADILEPYVSNDYFVAHSCFLSQPDHIDKESGIIYKDNVQIGFKTSPNITLSVLKKDGTIEGIIQKMNVRLEKENPFLIWHCLYSDMKDQPAAIYLKQLSANAVLINDEFKSSQGVAFIEEVKCGGLTVQAMCGYLSRDYLVLNQCKKIVLDGKILISDSTGMNFSWDLRNNRFEKSKHGFGLNLGVEPVRLGYLCDTIVDHISQELLEAGIRSQYLETRINPQTLSFGRELKKMSVKEIKTLASPVNLAAGDLDGDGDDELLLFDKDGSSRFPGIRIMADPVAVDFNGNGQRDIALSLDHTIAVYHPDGSLRWKKDLTTNAAVLSTGDLNGDGREELGLTQWSWAMVLDYKGTELIDEEVYHYEPLGGAFSDVDGDGELEFVAITGRGINICKSGRSRIRLTTRAAFGGLPCRIWIRDLDGDGAGECYMGGMGSEIAAYDLKKQKLKWAIQNLPYPPADIMLCDVYGDEGIELVAGCEDGFIYVIDGDGHFLFSRSMGAGISHLTCLQDQNEPDVLVVGMQNGIVLFLKKDLIPYAKSSIGEPIYDLNCLRRKEKPDIIVAAGQSGKSFFLENKFKIDGP